MVRSWPARFTTTSPLSSPRKRGPIAIRLSISRCVGVYGSRVSLVSLGRPGRQQLDSRPAPLHVGEEPDEEWRADDGGEDAERDLDRGGGARERVDEQEEAAAE